ncbi:hypothetical protein RJZ56_003503 [Blastomyces dermatitidis]|uniref:Uncharacterized protein n=3 Tax=Blastomyces TaxID=229219 RepID=A0A179UQY4_BLAGS|nr:uncharacterized protein BDBG_06266 [Blastomyces gilchristii SLH14081]XP_045272066.1 uncharacterized protein BDCG_00795 [Blastomyces dermatitidis ER-3]EGE83388.1 hypothetical protein BDDG_06332 [Blastomyces dermatitidis ATCC 18188]EQL36239.1 hypothetical protein BDFG_02209 [Blastomyces dermatitidis ATCC 26199]EEQ83990.1 hypothetical protein BDCG_00795 [Blastomyces dermatitidis ER-3]OAT10424.1 hypothetical protein BDBG_06266 [Blastomyces gilchristii SLH14081]
MTWYSLLPPGLTAFEAWLVRVFLILGTIIIAPWAFMILYDLLLYIWRASTYEIPIIGGRARGRQRPQAPSLSERPDGRRRTFSLTTSLYDGDDDGGVEDNSSSSNDNSDGSEGESDAFADGRKYGMDRDADGVSYRKVYAEPDVIGGDVGG